MDYDSIQSVLANSTDNVEREKALDELLLLVDSERDPLRKSRMELLWMQNQPEMALKHDEYIVEPVNPPPSPKLEVELAKIALKSKPVVYETTTMDESDELESFREDQPPEYYRNRYNKLVGRNSSFLEFASLVFDISRNVKDAIPIYRARQKELQSLLQSWDPIDSDEFRREFTSKYIGLREILRYLERMYDGCYKKYAGYTAEFTKLHPYSGLAKLPTAIELLRTIVTQYRSYYPDYTKDMDSKYKYE
jgi:hypothetical protein